jgi:mono/diheme cytochrome c family protein
MRRLVLLLILSAASLAQADDASLGRDIYKDFCASCHGRDLVSTGLAFDLRKFPQNESARFQKSVLDGTAKGMPAWKSQLSAEDVNAIWDYVKSGG